MNFKLQTLISKSFLVVATILFSAVLGFAQPPTVGPPGTPPTNPPAGAAGQPCWDAACIPIDGGMVFLLLAGALLGARLIYTLRFKNS
ncbi:hypothetical protein K6119_07210 [Paracrocinitomix mangrovi]|uniref:PID-CTERM protein-sorting domain-containing protein n=1 Tax=Paracrocinitomix mangrovi TaxID=2862509 RepID=UPI001C8DF7C7|nr:hypothetical protein [Paracrocinitomix mangrovi]UKN03301.1 hypothetical protein K6119_07210 [Paracrocinitomix mangrovi]